MLRSSFIHLAGVGAKTERRLWSAGLTRWSACGADPPPAASGLNVSPARWQRLRAMLEESAERLADGDVAHFGNRLPSGEQWRLFGEFARQAAYLDIETNGLDLVTAVVLHRAGRTLFFSRDENLHELPLHLAGVRLLITYNGKTFDWPMLRATFGRRLPEPAAHLDLRYPFARLKFRGGLKAIEKAIGLNRPRELEGIDGWSAVWLWRRHEQGDSRAMAALLRYCAEDVLNLKFLAEWGYSELARPLPVNVRLFARPRPARCSSLPAAHPEIMDECRAALARLTPQW